MTASQAPDVAETPQGEQRGEPAPPAPQAKRRGQRKVREGVVVSDRMQKTVVVEVARTVVHPLFGKTLRRSRRFKAHDEHNECRVGDRVLIMETRPLSKEKRWRVVRILDRAR